MKRDTVNYWQAGIAVVVAGLLLTWLLFRLTGRGGDVDDYVVYYQNVAGLKFGTPVYYEGYRVGEIREVRPDRSGERTRYRVTVGIDEGWGVPADSVAQISASGILGDVAINISEGSSKRMLEPGSEIEGLQGGDIFAAFNALAGEAQMLADEQLVPLLDLLKTRVDEFTLQLNDTTPEFVGQVQTLLARLNESAAAISELLSDDNVRQMDAIVANVADASVGLRGVVDNLDGSRQQVDQLLSELDTLVSSSRPDLQQTVGEMRQAVEALGGRLDNITAQLDAASRNMNEFSRSIRRNPGRLLYSGAEDDTAEEPLD